MAYDVIEDLTVEIRKKAKRFFEKELSKNATGSQLADACIKFVEENDMQGVYVGVFKLNCFAFYGWAKADGDLDKLEKAIEVANRTDT